MRAISLAHSPRPAHTRACNNAPGHVARRSLASPPLHPSLAPRTAARATAGSSSPPPPTATPPRTAADAVNAGQAAMDAANPAAALALFDAALGLDPTEEEGTAAAYNRACALAALSRWQEAADAVVSVVNERGLKIDVAVRDPDLARLRERREWLDALDVVRGGVSAGTLVKARAEARAPFRLLRLFLAGGLGAGAGLGLLIISARLVSSLQGGEGAPDLNESLKNFAINSAAVAVLGFIFLRDLKAAGTDKRAVEAEEALGRLQVGLGGGRVVLLASFRGTARPVLVSGPPGAIGRALKDAERLRPALEARGVRVVPVETGAADPEGALRALKRELAGEEGAARPKGFSPTPAAAEPGTSSTTFSAKPRRWELTPAVPAEWRAWLDEKAKGAGIAGSTFYVQVQMDGSVRSSGAGAPNWDRLVADLAPLDSLQTRLTDGSAATANEVGKKKEDGGKE